MAPARAAAQKKKLKALEHDSASATIAVTAATKEHSDETNELSEKTDKKDNGVLNLDEEIAQLKKIMCRFCFLLGLLI
ncbi:hypothetical protein Scep_012104 [Stephania cephalantha]|uniref:Uncharacterized protein n=1 Tax=Stephania cephalantha TaxID=152367 RepID=A0AAP0JEC4_9MAGN